MTAKSDSTYRSFDLLSIRIKISEVFFSGGVHLEPDLFPLRRLADPSPRSPTTRNGRLDSAAGCLAEVAPAVGPGRPQVGLHHGGDAVQVRRALALHGTR
jgi:hypothetical protein